MEESPNLRENLTKQEVAEYGQAWWKVGMFACQLRAETRERVKQYISLQMML